MVASLADTWLSRLLEIQDLGTQPFQTVARLQLVLSSSPEITIRTARPRDIIDSGFHRDGNATRQNQGGGIMVVIDSDLGSSTVQTEPFGDEIKCTIEGYQLKNPLSVIEPGESRRLSVVIGIQPSEDRPAY